MSLNVYDKTRQTLDKISGGGSAHRVINSEGTVVPQQPDLKFVNLNVENDSTNSATVIKGLNVTYGTTDLTPGESELETGALYLVYE